MLVAALLVLAIALPGASHAQGCDVVRLESDFASGDLRGTTPADGMACFDLRVPQGQNLSIELESGRNVSISVPGYYDARNDRMFLGDVPGPLEIRVFQLMRAAAPEQFAVRIRFEDAGTR